MKDSTARQSRSAPSSRYNVCSRALDVLEQCRHDLCSLAVDKATEADKVVSEWKRNEGGTCYDEGS